jgi:hypothetical protein
MLFRLSSLPSHSAHFALWILLTAGTLAGDPVTRVVDSSGKTVFHRIFVSGDPEFDDDVTNVVNAFDSWPDAPGSTRQRISVGFINDALSRTLTDLKTLAMPGQEVVLYYSGHGGDGPQYGAADTNADDPDGFDNHITSTNRASSQTITDDQLATMISGFRESVTLNVLLDSCWGGTFANGTSDLPSATNANGAAYGSHLDQMGPSGCITDEMTTGLIQSLRNTNGRPTGDSDGDGTLTSSELKQFLERRGDLGGSGQCSSGGKCASAVPEPPSLSLSSIVLLSMVAAARLRRFFTTGKRSAENPNARSA